MSSGIHFDPEAIRALAQILRDTDLTEIEVVEKDRRIRVARQPAAPPGPTMVWPAGTPMAHPSAPEVHPVAAIATPPDVKHPGLIASPMVGVAYLAPEPGAAPFVTLGAKVIQGQTLLLIEAMKTFNQIKAPRDGTVTRILIEPGMPVEYGEPLMVVE